MTDTARTLSVLILISLLFISLASAASFQLEKLLLEADANNPSLQVAKEQIQVADSKIDQATALADPQLGVSFSSYPINQLRSDVTPMTGNEIRLSQMLPFPGKLDAKGRIAAEKSHWFEHAYQDARLQLRRQVKDAWYRFLFQRQAIVLTAHNLQLLDDFIKLTETRYEVGKGLQQNVLKAQLQRSKQMDILFSLQQQKTATLAELNSLAGRATDQPLEVDTDLSPSTASFDLTALQQAAEGNRPLFASYRALIEQYKASRELAKLDYKPDFTPWVSYRWRDNGLADGGTDFISAGISFNLPVPNKRRQAAVAEADSSLRMAYQQRNQFKNKVDLTIHRALSQFEQDSRLAELYQGGIIPQATQTFQATLSAYQVDKVDFLDLLDSVMSLYRYQIDYARTLSNQQRSQAEIEAAAGLEAPSSFQAKDNIQ